MEHCTRGQGVDGEPRMWKLIHGQKKIQQLLLLLTKINLMS